MPLWDPLATRAAQAKAGALASAFAAGLLLTAAEWLTALSSGAVLAHGVHTLLAWLAGHTAVAGLTGLLGLGLVALSRRLPFPASRALPVVVALATLGPFVLVCRELASGEWISRTAHAPLLRFGAPVVLAAACGAGAWLCHRAFGSMWLRGALLALGIACSVINGSWFVGLYPAAHATLYAASVVLTLLAAADRGRHLTGAGWRPAVALVGMSSLGASPLLLTQARSDLAAHSQGLGLALSALTPASASHLEEALESCVEFAREVPAPPLTALPSGLRSTLLVVVDTLRADALLPVRDGDEAFVREGDTPAFDAWLSKSYRFAGAHSQASYTRGSMPSMFRSLEAFEDSALHGEPLSALAKRMGQKPIAVVPQYFLLPVDSRSQALLDGFERVEFYEKDRQDGIVDQARALLLEQRDEPFFAWLHFYNVHQPYYFGDGQTGSGVEGYRAALRWLDARFGELVEVLSDLGLEESTLVLLAADHGEHLGPGRSGHGHGVSEAELHVPLALRLPGEPGAPISAPVGNIDVVPTLAAAFGKEPVPAHRGTSLLPLSRGQGLGERTFYASSKRETEHALFAGAHKLVYSTAHGTFRSFDWRADPDERKDVFGRDRERDRRLVHALVRKNPGLFRRDLEQPSTRAALAAALERASAHPFANPELEFLLRVVALSGEAEVVERALRLFDAGEDLELRLLLFRHLGTFDRGGWKRRWNRVLGQASGRPDEAALVAALARRGFVLDDPEPALERIEALAAGGPSRLLDGWLELLALARPSPARLAPVSTRLLEGALGSGVAAAEDLRSIERLLAVIAALPRTKRGTGELEAAVRRFVALDATARAAALALGSVGTAASVPTLLELAGTHPSPRVRQAALRSLYQVDRSAALEPLLRAGEDPLLTVDAVQLLGRLGNPRALPFLRRTAKHHYNAWTRSQAKRALAAIEKRRGKR